MQAVGRPTTLAAPEDYTVSAKPLKIETEKITTIIQSAQAYFKRDQDEEKAESLGNRIASTLTLATLPVSVVHPETTAEIWCSPPKLGSIEKKRLKRLEKKIQKILKSKSHPRPEIKLLATSSKEGQVIGSRLSCERPIFLVPKAALTEETKILMEVAGKMLENYESEVFLRTSIKKFLGKAIEAHAYSLAWSHSSFAFTSVCALNWLVQGESLVPSFLSNAIANRLLSTS